MTKKLSKAEKRQLKAAKDANLINNGGLWVKFGVNQRDVESYIRIDGWTNSLDWLRHNATNYDKIVGQLRLPESRNEYRRRINEEIKIIYSWACENEKKGEH